MSARILLADDDTSLRFVLSQALGKEGYDVRATGNVATLVKWVREGEGDLVLSDVYMGDACVFDELPSMRMARPNLPFIVMSAQSTVATALSASGAGAYDYVPKPFDLDELLEAIRRALVGKPDAKTRAATAKAEKEERLPLIGRSPAMQEVYRVMARVAGAELAVLIEGESGVGKARIARAMHEHSRRARGPFVVASLAALNARELEHIVFGTGGKLDQARGGTLFLEDVDALMPEGQARMAGSLNTEIIADGQVRLIAASQRSLAQMVRQDQFRRDLFHQLNVVCIQAPPLRERLEDIPELARFFLARAKKEGLGDKSLDAAAIERLKTHAYPGNVRELENLLRRAAVLSPAPVITAGDISLEIAEGATPARERADDFEHAVLRRVAEEFVAASPKLPEAGFYDRLLAEMERPLILQALSATNGNQIRAAAVLGLNRNTLRKKIQALGISTGRGD